MTDTKEDKSVKLFFDSFAKHLRRIRDDGKDATQAYRAQILMGQLQQFEKSIDEWQREQCGVVGEAENPGAWMHIADLDALAHWLASEQKMMPVSAVFYLDHLGVWQSLYGKTPFPDRLKAGTWLERGTLAVLEDDPGTYVLYAHGQPRLLIVTAGAEGGKEGLIRFVSRLLPTMISAEITPKDKGIAADDVDMIAADDHFLEVLNLIRRVAGKDVTVLLEGESGTGKEVIASFVHKNSPRADKPYVAVNCAAIPAGLIESELFGHEKGAFTGAHQRKIGRLEEAQGGTLFLDEIGEIELAMQAKLLRFIQLREFHRVGGRQKMSVNIRIVAATNRDLKARVAEGLFREDLYYRLSVAPFKVPPLRARVDDIVPLAHFFMEKYAREFKMKIPEVEGAVFQLMAGYPFPGNVRELENLVQNILVLSQGERITPAHLPMDLRKSEPRGEVVRREDGSPKTWRPRGSIGKRIKLRRLRPATVTTEPTLSLPWTEALPNTNDDLKDAKQAIQDWAKQETMQLERRFLEHLLARAEGHMPTASLLSGINRTLLYKMLERTKS